MYVYVYMYMYISQPNFFSLSLQNEGSRTLLKILVCVAQTNKKKNVCFFNNIEFFLRIFIYTQKHTESRAMSNVLTVK